MPESQPSYNYANALPEDLMEQGFQVEMLPFIPEKQPVGNVLASFDEVREAFRHRCESGDGVRILNEGESVHEDEKVLYVSPQVHISEAQYDAIVPPDANRTRRRFIPADQAKAVNLLHKFPEQEAAALAQTLELPYVAMAASDVDYMSIDNDPLSRVRTIGQVFELASGDKQVRLYNFSDTPVSEAVMKKITNAMRHSNDLTGGSAFSSLSVMAIISAEDPTWGDPSSKIKTVARTMGNGSVILNERMLKDDWEERSQALSPHDDPHSVGGGIETVVFHELQHVLVSQGKDREAWKAFATSAGWEATEAGNQPGKVQHVHSGEHRHPFAYGDSEPEEDLPETAAAVHKGGEWADAIDAERKQAIADFWSAQHSGIEGPNYISVREVDLRALSRKIGTNAGDAPVAISPNLIYVVDSNSQQAA